MHATISRSLISLSALCLASTSCNFVPPPQAMPPDEEVPPLTVELVADGFERPVEAVSPPGDRERLFVVEQYTGLIRIVRLADGSIDDTPFLDLGSLISSGGNEQGLLGLAFHPDHATNGRFIVNYTDTTGDTVVAMYGTSDDPDRGDADSAVVLKHIAQPESNHNGGCVRFGPDGMLYIGMGDGGGAFDLHGPDGNAQNRRTLLGKILRIDVDAPAPHVPPDNPFVGEEDVEPEIWATGLRNPWRFSFDRTTGDLYIADVGQGEREEVNFAPAASAGGENYGWRCLEGNRCTGFSGCDCEADALTGPVFEYDHNSGCSVTGGSVYRGEAIPALRGQYFLADYCSAMIWSLKVENGASTDLTDRTAELAPGGGRDIKAVSSFGEDDAGEIYILDHEDGELFRIVRADE
jgi:glucose/arabinose dehydrogenase